MRQHRIKDNSCKYASYFVPVIKKPCRDQYGWVSDDTKDYMPGWKKSASTGNDTSELKGSKSSPWIYRSSVELVNAPYVGTRSTYKGGGYVFKFHRSKSKTERFLKKLEDQEWVDVRTRSVFIEFTLYNGNKNLFASVILLVEFQAAGGATLRTESKVFRIDNYVGGWGVIVLLFEIVFLIFTVYFLIKCLKDIKNQKFKYFKQFWNLLEFVTLSMSITAVAMYAMKRIFASAAMKTLKKSESGDYVNFVSISIWDETYAFIVAIVVFLATIKMLKVRQTFLS